MAAKGAYNGLLLGLGASRRHIAAQFLTEALILSILGGAAGTIIGAAAGLYPSVRAGRLSPTEALRTAWRPRPRSTRQDTPLWAIAPATPMAVAGLTAIPASIGAHRPVAETLRAGARASFLAGL